MMTITDDAAKSIESFILKEFSDIVSDKSSNKKTVDFIIKKCFGTGKMKMFEILPGIFLSHNIYNEMIPISNQNNLAFINPSIVIHYCIKGTMRLNLKNCFNAVVNKNESLFYAGKGEFIDSSISKEGIEVITLFCYIDSLSVLSELFSLDKIYIKNYLDNLQSRKDILVSMMDSTANDIINEIIFYIENNNTPFILLKGIELLMNAFKNFEKYKIKSEKTYKKELVNCIINVKQFLEDNWQKKYALDDLAKRFHISQTYLKEIFKYVYNASPFTYSRTFRLKKAKELLSKSEMSITDISGLVGYSNPSKFTAAFKGEFGVLPSNIRKSSG